MINQDKINQAREQGYSDTEIANFLSNQGYSDKINQAREQGYKDDEIIGYLSNVTSKEKKQAQEESSFLKENIARPILRAGKSIAASGAGLADIANMAAELPLYAGNRAFEYGRQAITGQEAQPYQPIFMQNNVAEATRQGFDKITGGLTTNRNKGEELLEIPQEIAVGFISPRAVAKGVQTITQVARKLGKKGLQKITGVKSELVKVFEEAGVNPTLADISQGQTTKTFQNLLGNFPGSRGVIEKATQQQIDDITKQIAGVTKSHGGTMQETGKKIQEGATQFKGLVEDRVGKLYDDLDKYVLAESQRQTQPKLMGAIDEWTSLQELKTKLIKDVELNTQRASSINRNAELLKDPVKKLQYFSDFGFEDAAKPEIKNALFELEKLRDLEMRLAQSTEINAKSYALNNAEAQKRLGFFRTNIRKEGAPLITMAGNDAKNVDAIRKQRKIQEQIVKDYADKITNKYMNSAVEDAKSLNNITNKINQQERVISSYEKYMSPEQMQSLLLAGQQKIPVNNLRNLINSPEIQDVAAVGTGDTAKVLARIPSLLDETGNVAYPRLKIFRTTIGRKLSSPSLMGDERAALKQVYGALSEDMKNAIVANGGEKGLQSFNKANSAFARSQEFLEANINPLIEAQTPEKVYDLALRGVKQGGSRIKPIMTVLNPTQKEFVRGTVAKRMGMASPGQQDAAGEIFSPAKFLTEWNKFSPEAKNNIFTKPQIESINNLNKAISLIKDTGKVRQTSNNLPYYSWLGLGGLIGAAGTGGGIVGSALAGTTAIGGANITAKMMTNPAMVKWFAKVPSIKPSEIPNHLKQLSKIAAANSVIREDVLDYLASITISDANAQEPNMLNKKDMILQQRQEMQKQIPSSYRKEDLNQVDNITLKRLYR
jgi:hypothetical protein